ncbi:Acetyl esterase/lipase [Pustulibacterium marinum]|uniref:Acetyl esterase/lipase n=1 Tax=Pustulibacterium marinum TaxID=1224947 RepID=A0A1I7EUF8_9FLAO|nr:alpha/beta hydrolase [Pustulibacterium marinum]SFU27528.1 Acetyl esterase/lipase [Pustulibacterium marinum]
MHYCIQNTLLIVFVVIVNGTPLWAQQPKARPYTVATTYEKHQKEFPFIKPIVFQSSDSVKVTENVVYKTTETSALQLSIYQPKNKKNTAVVLLIHGGGWISGSKENQQVMAEQLAKNGFSAVTVQYRLSDEAKYPAAVLDIKDAIRWVREHAKKYHFNPDQLAILGTSAGAQLATLVGVTANSNIFPSENTTSDAVQAIINIDGIVSFIHPEAEEGSYAAYWLGGSEKEHFETWKEASPLEYIDKNTPPTLFINSARPRFHAGRDAMIEKLNTYQIYSEVHTLENSPHSFWLLHPWFQPTLTYTVNFLHKTFKTNSL